MQASDLLSQEAAGQDLVAGVQAMQAQINALQSDLETQTDTQRRLTDARDVAWESFTALARRAAEVTIASETTTKMHLASTALPPWDHATPHTLLNVALALAVGEILALAFVLLQAQPAHAKRDGGQRGSLMSLWRHPLRWPLLLVMLTAVGGWLISSERALASSSRMVRLALGLLVFHLMLGLVTDTARLRLALWMCTLILAGLAGSRCLAHIRQRPQNCHSTRCIAAYRHSW